MLAEAQALVESAANCLAAAESLQEADGHRQLVEDFLNQTLEDADEADQLMERALEEELAAGKAEAAAGQAAAGAGVSVTLGAEQLAVRADSQATEAKQLITGEKDREARMLRSRCDDIRWQAQLLLSRM
ncbi:MAG: hypothetical protein GEV03_15740 [Streptosporangiales bacterium]|nr:hypothetical protein [Streptosporangiales bacterium]